MQLFIPWSSSLSVFVIERTAIIHCLMCTVLFSLVVPLLSLAVTRCYLFSLIVTCCITRCHSLSLVAPLVVTRCHWLWLVVIHCHSLYHSLSRIVAHCHSLSLVIPLVGFCCHSLSLDVPLVCLFMNDNLSLKSCLMVCLISKLISWSDIAFDMNTAMVTFKYSNSNIQLSLTWALQWSL